MRRKWRSAARARATETREVARDDIPHSANIVADLLRADQDDEDQIGGGGVSPYDGHVRPAQYGRLDEPGKFEDEVEVFMRGGPPRPRREVEREILDAKRGS